MNTEFIKDQLKLMLKKSSISHGDNNLVLVERLSADNNTNTVFITLKKKLHKKIKNYLSSYVRHYVQIEVMKS